MTPTQIETHARQLYNAVGDSFFPQEMIFNIIYQAQLEMGIEADIIEQTFSTTSVADQREYTYPDNTVSIKRIEYNGEKITKVELDADPKNSLTEPTGTPDSYAIWNDVIYLFPTPDTTSDTIKMFTYERAGAVTATSTLQVPAQYHLGIVDLILAVFFAKDKDRQMSIFHRNIWNETKERALMEVAKRKRTDRNAQVRDSDYEPETTGFNL